MGVCVGVGACVCVHLCVRVWGGACACTCGRVGVGVRVVWVGAVGVVDLAEVAVERVKILTVEALGEGGRVAVEPVPDEPGSWKWARLVRRACSGHGLLWAPPEGAQRRSLRDGLRRAS